ncbi:hypothetical protein MSPP1_001612 [Malassezia sp. CBS 17886]|nr:hypothetical protein MSPP1_001612 [Malassezia sp. CBS 17886]
MPYTGWTPARGEPVAVRGADTGADAMWTEFVAPRRPVVLDALLDDPEWHGTQWTNLAYLAERAGNAVVTVEPVHPDDRCFGTGVQRSTMSFADYLRVVQDPSQAGRFYLTTQYDQDAPDGDDDADEPPIDTLFPSPTHALARDFPMHPRILGRLVLQQCNLWLGSAREPTSSGLHHDFHDNLYLLLSGRKRFLLFPPDAHPHLHVRGHVHTVHPNGLVTYAATIRADGLDDLDAAHWRLVAAHAQRKRARATASHAAYEAARAAYEEISARYRRALDTGGDKDELRGDSGRGEGGQDGSSGEEAFDDSARSDEQDSDDDDPPLFGDADDADPSFSDDADEGEALLAALDASAAPNARTHAAAPGDEPPSFSRIRARTLQTHFHVAPAVAGATHGPTPGAKCPEPIVVDLVPGQMLYLPAGWFHEVTSWGDDPHMALNYWMHPPDGPSAAEPYRDADVWAQIRQRVHAAGDRARSHGRKRARA